jgi:hypothetical protein
MSVNYLLKDKSAPQSDIKCNSVNVNRLSAEKVSAANVADASPITFIAPNGQVFSFLRLFGLMQELLEQILL